MAEARDPVCGMIVDTQNAVAEAQYGGTAFYFCSVECQQSFESNPAQYSAAGRSDEPVEMEKHEPPHTTTGPMTAPKFGSAGSGGAEYEMIPEQHKDEP